MGIAEFDREAVRVRMDRLLTDLLRGKMARNSFLPWEITLMLDIEQCCRTRSDRRELLRRYQRAVQRHFERGGNDVLLLSEYLEGLRQKREAVMAS
jgi:pantothenate kinase-related protein Tda10